LQKPYTLKRLRESLSTRPDETASAAVAILVKEWEDDLELFLVKRAEVEGDPWSGDMAFPGGKRSPEDKNIYQTAKRELWEETGIDLKEIEPIGVMPSEYSSVKSQMTVQPIIFHFENMSNINLSHELQSYIWAPLKRLETTRTRGIVKGLKVPIFKFKDETIWGLTFRMLNRIIEILKD
jgi:8-oxo-dGTP pyrophosphatase MutT (NUDIX family)